MRAVQVTSLGGPEALELVELDEPELREGFVEIEVHAAGVSFPDLLLSKGEYQMRPELPFVLGTEAAGIVSRALPGSPFSPGERVAAFPGTRAYAESLLVNEEAVFPLPGALSFETGAALLLNYLTVHFALKRRGRMREGETVLVHGAAGGIGTAGIQLAKAFGGRVVAVASTKEKAEYCSRVGADEVVMVSGFKDAVLERTGGSGVDIVLDPVGGDRFTDSLRCLRQEGRMLVVGFTSGEIPTVKVNRLLLNNIDVAGVASGAFWIGDTTYLREEWDELAALAADGRIDPPIGSTYELADAAEALKELEERRVLGKSVLRAR